ncbi:transposase [Agrobacterium tumefaciens]|uniref:Transposase n=1 Tax=Agrobacterium tumefaciens TaxID=358 RepID=A0AA44JAL0_AGRTU|nr:transposase [Agrobacterium tumefaciens]NSL25096.1 transposase [Agrobacterium tumefaciens]NTB86749.1 transposase [Agrobacterium tumefaciens]NTC21078.1 transposase [Agrobacterium tumefaciens]NTC30626.1 transposase [Agrobacterium tumefaciens]NTC57712.1 transposase [Agrobacterium tumefaciens]
MRRFWSEEFKLGAVEEACRPGVNISAIARRIGITPKQAVPGRRQMIIDRESSFEQTFFLIGKYAKSSTVQSIRLAAVKRKKFLFSG